MSKFLVISTSLRVGSNSDAMADEFMRGAKDTGNEVEKVSLRGKKIAFIGGVTDCGDIKGNPALAKAYELGKAAR